MLGTDFEISVNSLSSDCLTASVRQIPQTVDLGHATFTDLSMQLKSASGAIQWKTGTYREHGTTPHTSDSGTMDNNPVPGATSKSPANCAPMQVSLRDNMIWPTNQKGFSLSIWLKVVSNVQDFDRDENYHSSNGEKKQAFSKGRSSPLNPCKFLLLYYTIMATLSLLILPIGIKYEFRKNLSPSLQTEPVTCLLS